MCGFLCISYFHFLPWACFWCFAIAGHGLYMHIFYTLPPSYFRCFFLCKKDKRCAFFMHISQPLSWLELVSHCASWVDCNCGHALVVYIVSSLSLPLMFLLFLYIVQSLWGCCMHNVYLRNRVSSCLRIPGSIMFFPYLTCETPVASLIDPYFFLLDVLSLDDHAPIAEISNIYLKLIYLFWSQHLACTAKN